jgi:hypothetical protein
MPVARTLAGTGSRVAQRAWSEGRERARLAHRREHLKGFSWRLALRDGRSH